MKLPPMLFDAWMQHPTLRFITNPMFSSLIRWMGEQVPTEEIPIEMTLAAMDDAGIEMATLSAWNSPRHGEMISNDEVAAWVEAHPERFVGLASVDLDRPMEAVRELRHRVRDQGFKGLRMLPWLWDAPPTDRRYYPLFAECVELGVPFCTQVGHAGPLMPSEPGRPIPYIDQIAIDFPELVIVGGHIGYPWTEEMVAVARKHENVYIDTSAWTAERMPLELVNYMKSRGGRQKVLFGSNSPMILPAKALEAVDALELDDETRGLFLGGNAERIFLA
ncbi:MAG: amidohydrolase family protein [Solirubrobacterales bacterium]|nr:amidohydrolase family protein [Solirubrobacterales bacterium]